MQTAEFVDRIAAAGRSNLRAQARINERADMLRHGVEAEYLHGDDAQRLLPTYIYARTLDTLAARDDTDAKREAASPRQQVIGVSFKAPFTPLYASETKAGFDYDYGPEAEIQTEIVESLEQGYRQLAAIEDAAADALPTGALYRQGLSAGLAHDAVEDVLDWDSAAAADPALEAYEMSKRRYTDLRTYYTLSNMALGGTGSLQVTGNPFAGHTDDIDAAISQFFAGDEDTPGIPALSPVFFGPFMNSPRIEDGELVTRYGREDAYRLGREQSPIISAEEGAAKYGYWPEFADIDGVADIVEANIERPVEFLCDVPVDWLEVNGPALHRRDAYDYLDADTELSVMAAEKRGNRFEPIYFKDFVEEQYLEGIVSLQDGSGDWHAEPVALHVDDDTMAEQLEQFYTSVQGSNLPSFRIGMNTGAMESRDVCNSPYEQEAVAMQAAVYERWPELQAIAAAHGITNDHAEALRDGIPRDGLDYTLPDGQPVTAVLADMRDTLVQGALDASETPGPARQLATYLDDAIATGDTPADQLYQAAMDGDFATAYGERAIR